MKQQKINKILVIVLIALVAFIGYSRITEHKRMSYYVCYDFLVSGDFNTPHDEAKEICHEKVYERND